MSSAKNWTAYVLGAGGSDAPAISPMEPVPEKETPVTWVLVLLESWTGFGESSVSPILKVTVGFAPV